MTYAFSFDARYCSGCKACQAACKDKNNLPTGVLWRRVIEVAGGEWRQNGEAWNNSVFAYNLSISCNHCTHPKCAGVCPTKAYTLLEDGIVFLDTTKCVGCGYCAWACPYGAPQYDPAAGHMTKCDFCLDYLEQGLPPVCVAACPLRVLNYGEMESITEGIPLWNMPSDRHPYPLPAFSHSEPHLAINPHPAMTSMEKKQIANLEEVQPRRSSTWEELPLFFFTLLAQLAVGSFWAMSWMFPMLWLLVERDSPWLRLLPTAVVGLSLGAGMLVSFAHLGTKKNAWRVFRNLRKSWLSREILSLSLFAASWLLTTSANIVWHIDFYEWTAITGILGIALIYSMSQVYRLPAMPGWNTWQTSASFMLTALLLGVSAMTPLLAYESSAARVHMPLSHWTIIGCSMLVLLLAQFMVCITQHFNNKLRSARLTLLLAGTAVMALGLLQNNLHVPWLSVMIFLIVVSEESIGRWLFYSLGQQNHRSDIKLQSGD